MQTSAFVPPPEATRLVTRRVETQQARRAESPFPEAASAPLAGAQESFAQRLDSKLTENAPEEPSAQPAAPVAQNRASDAQDTPDGRAADGDSESRGTERPVRSSDDKVEAGANDERDASQRAVDSDEAVEVRAPGDDSPSVLRQAPPVIAEANPLAGAAAFSQGDVQGAADESRASPALTSVPAAAADGDADAKHGRAEEIVTPKPIADPLATLAARRPAIRQAESRSSPATERSTEMAVTMPDRTSPVQADQGSASLRTLDEAASPPVIPTPAASEPESQSGGTAPAQTPRQAAPDRQVDRSEPSSAPAPTHPVQTNKAAPSEAPPVKVVHEVGLKPESLLGEPGVRSAGSARPAAMSARASAERADAESAFAAAVNRGLSAAIQQRGGSVLIRLQPDSLGSLKIQMTIEKGVVSVDLQAASAEARDLLSTTLGSLRSSLEGKGLSVERLSVAPAPMHQQPAQAGPSDQQSGTREDPRSQTQHDAGGGASRGREDGPHHDRDGGAGAAWSDQLTGEPAAAPSFDRWFRLSLDAVA